MIWYDCSAGSSYNVIFEDSLWRSTLVKIATPAASVQANKYLTALKPQSVTQIQYPTLKPLDLLSLQFFY